MPNFFLFYWIKTTLILLYKPHLVYLYTTTKFINYMNYVAYIRPAGSKATLQQAK